MFDFLSEFFCSRSWDTFGVLPLRSCRILRPYLLERAEITEGSVVLWAVPYLTKAAQTPDRNLSAYAVPRDYHAYLKAETDLLLSELRRRMPHGRFACFFDHSPIDEVDAAARAGLGVIGKNHLLLTEKYSSYVFLAALYCDLELPTSEIAPRFCENCGACLRVCPAADLGTCLSALTQKKGALTQPETEALLRFSTAWGCDLCQEVCPHTRRALKAGTLFSPIPYFNEECIPHLTTALLDQMSDRELAARAYAWRGRQTIRRNLCILEGISPQKTEENKGTQKNETEQKGEAPLC